MSYPTKTIDGVECTHLHSGQKRSYGDSYYEWEIASDKPFMDVRKVCTTKLHQCDLPKEQWLKENREKPSMDRHFRSHFEFLETGDGKYLYRVTSPYTD